MNQTYSYADVWGALMKLCVKKGRSVAQALLCEYGVNKAYDLSASQWEEFCLDARAVLSDVAVVRGMEEAKGHPDEMPFDELMADLLSMPDANMPMVSRDSIGCPALNWNKPTSIDRFPGFIVTSSTTDDDPIHLHPLQKMAEGKEGFGSAALLKVR